MNKVILLISIFFLCNCAGGTIPKAGPVDVQVTPTQKRPGIRSSNAKSDKIVKEKLEIPAYSKDEDIVSHIGYTASYNHEMLIPNWVAYELTAEECEGTLKGKESFCWDPELNGRQPNREDYKNDAQWDRGHMAPKADMKWSVQAYEESYFLSNVCPQNRSFNSGSWASTEKFSRRIAHRYGSAYIVCGPIVTTNQYGTLGEPKIVIPDAFYKAILVKKGQSYSAIAFVMQNIPEKQSIKCCSMSVDNLEQMIGRDLFVGLDDEIETNVESWVNYSDWGI